jgi:uncharacterized membrane protein YqjE
METETPPDTGVHLAGASRQLAHRLLVIFENRLKLLGVELEEERERLARAFWLVVLIGAFGLMAVVTLTALIVIALWQYDPLVGLLILTIIYAAAAAFFYFRLSRLQREWQTLAATIEQLKKDRECLEKNLN